MAAAVYILCFLSSAICALLLVRSYRLSRTSLLLWSAVAFLLLAVNNLLVVFDLLVLPALDLTVPRRLVSLVAVGTLIFGFIWESD